MWTHWFRLSNLALSWGSSSLQRTLAQTTVAAFWTVWQIEKIVHKKKVPNPYLTQYTTLCLSWVDSGEHFGSSNLHALTMATWSIWNSWMFMHQRTSWNISMRCHTASPLMLQKFRCRHCQNNQSKASIFQSSNGGVEKRRPGST